MKKYIILFTLLIAAAGGSVGAYLVVKDKKDTENKKVVEEIKDLKLFNFDSESINEITIRNTDGTYELKRVDDKWVTTGDEEFPLDQDYVNLICTYASTLEAEESHSGEPEVFGLDEEHANVITLKSDNETYTFSIGNISPTKDYYYISVDGKSGIYAVPTIYGSAFDTDKLTIKSKALVHYGDNEIAEIILKKDGVTTCDIVFDEETHFWSLKEDSEIKFDTTAASSMASVIVRLEAEQLLEEELDDLSKYGFDDPYGEAIIKGLDGTERKLIFGNATSDDVYRYIYIPDEDQVQVYYNYDVDFIDKTLIDFIVKTSYNPNTDLVTGVTLTLGEENYEFGVDMLKEECTYGDELYDLKIENVYSAFNNFYNSFSTKMIVDIDNEASPELKDPLLTVVYHLKEGGDYTYQLVEKDSDSCYVFIDGKYDGEIVSKERLTGKNSIKAFLEKFLKTPH